jgi:predicted acetyltransferase
MMAEIRPVLSDEAAEFLAMLEISAGREPGEAGGTLPAQTLAAVEGGRIVGGTGADPVELTVPGPRPVPAAKITLTGLLPTHRRRGLASALMVRQLHDLAASGMPLAVLTSAESNVPGRHGFGVASRAMAAEVTIGPVSATLSGVVDLVPPSVARDLLPALFERHRLGQVGQVSRSGAFWDSWFADAPLLRASPGPRFVAVTDGGYLTYRLGYGPLRERPVESLLVEDLIAVTDAARRALWAFCLGFAQAAKVAAANLPVDEPAAWLVPDPRDLRTTGVRPFLRLRIVDVAVALAARRYRHTDEVVLDVWDGVLDRNNGRFRLCGGPDVASCEPTSRPPDLALPVGDLAAVYLGDTDFTTLARAGRVHADVARIARADAMFGWRPAPWTVTDW